MRGPKPSHPIELTADETQQLEQLVRAHTTPQALAMRARIILTAYAHPEQSNQQIALAMSVTDRTVRKWRARWVQTHQLSDAPAVEHRGVFPLRYARRLLPSLVAYPNSIRCHSHAGVAQN